MQQEFVLLDPLIKSVGEFCFCLSLGHMFTVYSLRDHQQLELWIEHFPHCTQKFPEEMIELADLVACCFPAFNPWIPHSKKLFPGHEGPVSWLVTEDYLYSGNVVCLLTLNQVPS